MVASHLLYSSFGDAARGSKHHTLYDMARYPEPAYVHINESKILGSLYARPEDQSTQNNDMDFPFPSLPLQPADDILPIMAPPPGLVAPAGLLGVPQIGQTIQAAAAYGASQELPWQKQRAMTWPMQETQEMCEPQKQRKTQSSRIKRHNVLLIATHLNELQQEDPGKILIVRKINRLGFDSAERLKEHFEQFGPVEKVRLSNAHAKQPNNFRSRVRPSGIAFLLFQDPQDAARAYAAGESQIISNVEVFVRRFERRQGDSSSSIGDEQGSPMNGSNDDDDELAPGGDDRFRTATW